MLTGLGNLLQEYRIPDTIKASCSCNTACALALCDKVHGELNHIEKEGVISKVDGPTTWWCAWMMVAKSQLLPEFVLKMY